MRLLSVSRTRQLQRTLKNLRVSLLCFLLTFLVLRNTIGAGKFGTPAQDFEEIRQHLQHVSLHRKLARVLTEAVDEDNPPLLTVEEQPKDVPLWSGSHLKGLPQANVVPLKYREASRIIDRDEQRRVEAPRGISSHGDHNVLVVTGSTSPSCESPGSERFLLKSLNNKLDYSRSHGFEVFYSNGNSDFKDISTFSRASLLQALMKKNPNVEWLWWVNAAYVITDMSFELPFLNYLGVDFVLLGSDDAVEHHGSLLIDFNSDSFLIRNCQWSLELLQSWTQMGSLRSGDSDQYRDKKMEIGTKEVFVERATAVRSQWQNTVEKTEKIFEVMKEEKTAFITHLVGCNPCSKAGNMEAEVCLKHMEKVVYAMENQVMQSNGLQPRSLSSS